MRKKAMSLELLTRKDLYFAIVNNKPIKCDPKYNKRLEILKRIVTEELSEKQREAIELYYFANLTIEQTALLLGVEKSAISHRLLRARRTIEKFLRYSF